MPVGEKQQQTGPKWLEEGKIDGPPQPPDPLPRHRRRLKGQPGVANATGKLPWAQTKYMIYVRASAEHLHHLRRAARVRRRQAQRVPQLVLGSCVPADARVADLQKSTGVGTEEPFLEVGNSLKRERSERDDDEEW